jgi:hypothetical protein
LSRHGLTRAAQLGGDEWPQEHYTFFAQKEKNVNKKNKWVELPNCRGDSGEISLVKDV